MQQQVQNIVTIEQQSKITMTGVGSVDSFSEGKILLTVNGKKVTIAGSGLKVLAFSEGSGNFSASGKIESLRFQSGAGSLKGFLKS